jgi:hypothetical protein
MAKNKMLSMLLAYASTQNAVPVRTSLIVPDHIFLNVRISSLISYQESHKVCIYSLWKFNIGNTTVGYKKLCTRAFGHIILSVAHTCHRHKREWLLIGNLRLQEARFVPGSRKVFCLLL